MGRQGWETWDGLGAASLTRWCRWSAAPRLLRCSAQPSRGCMRPASPSSSRRAGSSGPMGPMGVCMCHEDAAARRSFPPLILDSDRAHRASRPGAPSRRLLAARHLESTPLRARPSTPPPSPAPSAQPSTPGPGAVHCTAACRCAPPCLTRTTAPPPHVAQQH